MSNYYSDKLKKNEILDIECENRTYKFIVDGFNNEINSEDKIYISKQMYDELISNNEKISNLIILNRWKSQYNDAMYQLNKVFNPSNVRPKLVATNSHYEVFITISYVFLWVLIVLFSIVLIITCFNIIQDEKKKNVIYYRVGYRKIILKLFNLLKIILLITTSIIFAFIIFITFYFLYNLII